MNRKGMIGAIAGLLLLTGIVGANLVMAGGRHDTGRSVRNQEATTDDDNLECPAQGLPACAGQMNDDKTEGPENEAEGPENEADDQNEKAEGPENEANDQNESDTHEDAQGADHQCPPDCDTANGEKP